MKKINQSNTTSQPIVDRKLPQRSFLKFYFPLPERGANGRYYVVNLPFYENISIRESKKARYQRYSLISRSSNLYTYMGADSRVLSVDFNITLPHLLDLHPEAKQLTDFTFVSDDIANKQKEKDRFKSPAKASTGAGGASVAFKLGNFYTKEQVAGSLNEVFKSNWYRNSNLVDKQLLISRYKDAMDAEAFKYLGIDFFNFFADIEKLRITSSSKDVATLTFRSELERADRTIDEATLLKYKMIDLVIYWTNIIRSSVVNNSENPMYGPPLLRLRHGIMYQDIPCICTDYTIEANENAGYDVDTLLPRQLKVSLKLEELRTGSFGKFDPTSSNIIERDNLAGWEAVVLGPTTSMDPGLGGYGVGGP
jgi:hypothetical protein